MLNALGLDDTDGTVYHAVLAGPASARGLSARTGLPEADVSAALRALAALNLVSPGIAPGEQGPAGPRLGLAAIGARRDDGAARGRRKPGQAQPSHIDRLEDPEAARALAQHLISTAETGLQVTVPAPDAGEWQAGSLLEYSGLPSGVPASVLYHVSACTDPAALAQAARLAAAGSPPRAAKGLPPVLVISDQRAALIPLDPADPGNGVLCVREPAIVAVLAVIFSTAWDAATPMSISAPAGALTAREHALLGYLVAGLTDEATARRLGISVRTARRQVAALMGKLGATSRFQAGHQAAQRGWL